MAQRQRSWGRTSTAALAVLVVLVAAPVILAASALRVDGYCVDGNVVHVTVSNTDEEARSGTVEVQAVVDGKRVWGYALVSVAGAGQKTVAFPFTSTVEGVISVGITEAIDPF